MLHGTLLDFINIFWLKNHFIKILLNNNGLSDKNRNAKHH